MPREGELLVIQKRGYDQGDVAAPKNRSLSARPAAGASLARAGHDPTCHSGHLTPATGRSEWPGKVKRLHLLQ
jgi:hypothetical protein